MAPRSAESQATGPSARPYRWSRPRPKRTSRACRRRRPVKAGSTTHAFTHDIDGMLIERARHPQFSGPRSSHPYRAKEDPRASTFRCRSPFGKAELDRARRRRARAVQIRAPRRSMPSRQKPWCPAIFASLANSWRCSPRSFWCRRLPDTAVSGEREARCIDTAYHSYARARGSAARRGAAALRSAEIGDGQYRMRERGPVRDMTQRERYRAYRFAE